MTLRGRILLAVVTAAAATMVFVSPAGATHVVCGQTITETTVLDSDLGPCPNNGLIIETDGVKLDLNGYSIIGVPATGDGAGVLVRDATGVTVTNGTVRGFDGGVVIENGGGNTVTYITARDNIGQSAAQFSLVNLYGDGIAVLGSSDNHIANNTVINNGPFSGIGLYERPDADHFSYVAAPTERNSVMDNVVEDNQSCRYNRTTGARSTCDNDGIRVEPGVGPDNVIKDNVVRRNGLDGIALFSDADGNVVMRNLVEGNGFWGAVAGDGIRVFGSLNTIHRNETYRNAAGGISVGRRTGTEGSLPVSPVTGIRRGTGNNIMRNVALDNVRWDLWDSNPCGLNTWKRNTFRTGAICVE